MEEFKHVSRQLFVDPSSEETQAGRLKLEGLFQSGFFRCVKSYVLNPFSDQNDKRVVKSKGVPRPVCEILPNESFHIQPRKRKNDDDPQDNMFLHNVALQPTMGEQIVLRVKRRRMANPLNCKRILTEVNIPISARVHSIPLIFQNQNNTLPLE